MRVDILTTPEQLNGLEESWRRLYERAPDVSPYQHPGWLLPWWRHLGVGDLCSLAMWEEGRLVALAPLLLQPWRDLRQVTLLGSGASNWMGVLAEPDYSRAAVETMLRYLRDTQQQWDVCDFQGLSKASPLCEAGFPGMIEIIRSQPVGPVALLPGRRTSPPVAQRPDVMVERVMNLLDLEATFPNLPVEGASREEKEFEREALTALWTYGIARAYRMFCGGHLVATLWGFLDKSRFWTFRCNLDPARRSLNPLNGVLEFAVADAMAEGARVFDFPRESNKLPWQVRMENSYQVLLRPQREHVLRQAS